MLSPSPPCPCLATAGLSLSSTSLHLASVRHRLLFPCLLCILLSTSLHPLTMGMMFGVMLVFYFLGGMLLQLAGLKDSIRRVRMVASDRRCPFLWLITLGFWDRRVQTKMVRIKGYKREVVNLWPLQLGQFSEELFLQHGTRVTHTAIVEVAGRFMKVMYPVNNMARKYEDISNDEVEVFTFHHKISLVKADISLTGTKDKPQSKKFSKSLPICVQSSDSGHLHSFFIFPRVKRRKEALYNLLLRAQVEDKMESPEVEDLVEKVMRECRLKCGGEDRSMEMINLLINRFCARFLTEEMIFDPIQKILRSKLIRRFGQIFKNLGLKNIDLGDRYPMVKKMGKPWYNERGLWAKVVICETIDKRSITVEANSLNIHNSPNSSSTSDEEVSPILTVAQLIDQEIAQLSFTLDILEFELVILLNIPPPSPPQIPPLRIWIGLCHLPHVDIHLAASGAKPVLTSLLNTIMPVVRAATIKKLNSTLKSNWVFPNMKDFTFPLPSSN